MIIHLRGEWSTRRIWLNGKRLSPVKSQKHYNHSPDGFAWAYNGSGASQLALAICLELNLTRFYMEFRRLFIATLPEGDFSKHIDISVFDGYN